MNVRFFDSLGTEEVDDELQGVELSDPRTSGSPRRAIAWAGAAIGLPIGLYIVLRPANYGLTPNSLDPIFYSGYAINFDDVMNAVSDQHYFVSRWSAYYPGYIANAIAGPFVGRLLLRLVVSVLILCSLWRLGTRQRWSWPQRILIGSMVLSMPMFVRAFFTDYVEWLVVGLGVCLVALCVFGNGTFLPGLLVGASAAAIVVANPIAVTAVMLPILAYLVGTTGWRQRFLVAVAISLAGVIVVAGGLVLFRWRYGIDNVYQPSIEFIRTYEGRDGWKSSNVDWLGHFTWIFATPILLLVALGLALRRSVRFERYELIAFGLCGLQWTYQWFDQFVRDGNGLEISYYWSFAYPTFAIAFALLVGRLTSSSSSAKIIAILTIWSGFLVVGVPDVMRLPAGVAFFVIVGAATALLVVGHRRSAAAACIAFVVLIGWTQIGSPTYTRSDQSGLDTNPYYDRLFRQDADVSETIYREAVWFEEQMDRIQNDASTSFVPVSRWSASIVGLYAPHVVAHVMGVEPGLNRLDPTSVAEVARGIRPIVAVFGPPGDVDQMVRSFSTDLNVPFERLLDVTHDSALGYRLAVFSMPDSATLPFTWPADSLPVAQGRVVDGNVEIRPPLPAGIVTYGPFIGLPNNRYEVVLRYAADASAGRGAIGGLEVVALDTSVAGSVELLDTRGADRTVRLAFTADDPETLWEFRTTWLGTGKLTVKSITLRSVRPN